MARNLSRHLATHSAILAVLLLGLQFHPLQVAPSRLQGIAEVSVLRQLLQVKLMKKTSLVARLLARKHLALHVGIGQDIEAADGIRILLRYTL